MPTLVAANKSFPASSFFDGEIPAGAAFINHVKRSAKKANPRAVPFRLQDGSEWFILLCDGPEYDGFRADRDVTMANMGEARSHPRYQDQLGIRIFVLILG